MLSIREIRSIALNVDAHAFGRELGPFALIQQPKELAMGSGTMVMGVPVNARATQVARPEKLTADVLSMLFRFDDLVVATLPPVDSGALTVGRAPDCDLVIDDPSVSKRHARIKWNPERELCTLEDLQSTNGTMLNSAVRLKRPVALRDGDIIGFGEVAFWYLLTQTLHDRLAVGSGAVKLGSRSG